MNNTKWKEVNKDRDIVLYQPHNGVNKPSKIVKSMYSNSLTTKQKNTYNFLVGQLLNNEKSILDFNEISFKLKDLQNAMGIQKYHDFEKDLKRLQRTLIEFTEENSHTCSVLISSFTLPRKYNENSENDEVIVRFDTKLTQTFKSIDTYITLPFNETQKLKNTHSITYFEIFKKQLNKYEHKVTIRFSEEELRALLNIGKKQYSRPTQFKEWCVDKPLDEINTHTNVSVSYVREKVSKGVYTYKFSISQSIELSFNDFINRFKKYCSDMDFSFTYKKKKLYYKEHIDDYNNTSLLLTDFNIEENKNVEDKSQYKNNETFNKVDAEEIHYEIYENFINNNIGFLYSFLFGNSVNNENINVLEDIDPGILDTIQDILELHFKRVVNE